MYNNPSRIVFWIEYSAEMKSYKVTQKVVIGCNDYTSYLENIRHRCKTHLKIESELSKRVSKTNDKSPLLATAAIFDNDPNDQRVVQSCSNLAVGYVGTSLESYPSNFYFRQYKPSETDLDPIMLGVLFSNCSIVNKG